MNSKWFPGENLVTHQSQLHIVTSCNDVLKWRSRKDHYLNFLPEFLWEWRTGGVSWTGVTWILSSINSPSSSDKISSITTSGESVSVSVGCWLPVSGVVLTEAAAAAPAPPRKSNSSVFSTWNQPKRVLLRRQKQRMRKCKCNEPERVL